MNARKEVRLVAFCRFYSERTKLESVLFAEHPLWKIWDIIYVIDKNGTHNNSYSHNNGLTKYYIPIQFSIKCENYLPFYRKFVDRSFLKKNKDLHTQLFNMGWTMMQKWIVTVLSSVDDNLHQIRFLAKILTMFWWLLYATNEIVNFVKSFHL